MSYNGSGTFQINTSGQPVVTGTVISSTAFNALTSDLATGLTTAITKDGQTTTTVRIPFSQGINSSLATDTTNGSSGSIYTAGGVGITKALYVGTNATVVGTLGVTGAATFSATPIFSALTASSAVATDASKNLVSVTNTGTGNNVLATSPTLVTPALGTPSSGVVTNLTGTASININGTVGATIANTGAFTTLTTSGNVGIGGGTPGSNPKLSLYGGIRFLTTEAASATYTGIGSIASDMVSISTAGTERMRVTNQGGVSFGATGTAYGATGEALISQGDAPPIWGAAGIGNGQTWQTFTVGTARVLGTTYTNSTGKPIFVSLSCLGTASASFSIDGVQVSEVGGTSSVRGMMGGIVPNGSTYVTGGTGLTVDVWAELR